MKEKHFTFTKTTSSFSFREAKGIHKSSESHSTSSSSSSSSSSSFLVTHICSKSKNQSKIQVNSKSGGIITSRSNRSKASNENDFPISTNQNLKFNKNHSNIPLLSRQKSVKIKTPTTSKPVSRSQLSSHNISHSLKKSSSGTQGCRVNSKDMKNLNSKNGSNIPIVISEIIQKPARNDKRTPLGRRDDSSAFQSNSENVESAGEKTPPIEASVSPEIQSGTGTASRGLPVVSAATPVCYGAGHLLSGIRDKRKCRPRGLLIIGEQQQQQDEEETNLLSGFRKIAVTKENSDEIIPKSRRPSFVPPPVEASMRWLSSPNGEFDDEVVQKGYDVENSCQVLSSDFVSDDRVFQSERFSSFQGFSGTSDGDFLSPSSQTLGFDEIGCFQMMENHRSSSIGKKSSFSSSSLSCGNVVQTPTSDLSSEKPVYCPYSDSDQRNMLDLDADIQGETSISAMRTQMPLLNNTDDLDADIPGEEASISTRIQMPHCHKLEECASWVSDSTLASISMSRMRISWREGLGLATQTFNTEDELDCYRCLSDEKNDCDKANLDSVAIEKQKLFGGDLISTTLLKLDSSNVDIGKETLFQTGLGVSAESICIDGDNLAASGDSDWTRSYKTDLFQV